MNGRHHIRTQHTNAIETLLGIHPRPRHGALAGLVGMPLLFGQDHNYGTTFQSGLGFAGIAIALLGRNNAVGIVFASLLWAFLDVQSNALQIQAGVAQEIVFIIQGVILFAVVIAYELIRRTDKRLEQQRGISITSPGGGTR